MDTKKNEFAKDYEQLARELEAALDDHRALHNEIMRLERELEAALNKVARLMKRKRG